MSRNLLFHLFLAWLSCSQALLADPLVNFPQGDFSCTVAVTPHSRPKPDPKHPERRYSPILKNIAITQIGKIRRDISVWSDNSVSELWDLTDKKLSLRAAGKEIYLLRGFLRDHAGPPLLRFDARSVSWITAKALNEQSAGGEKPLHYQARVVVSDPGEKPVVTALYQAWIDPKSLLPLRFDDGEALYVLMFSQDPPAGPLPIPTNIQREIDRFQAAYAPRPTS